MTVATNTPPAIWIGCLGCYNAGRLEGAWVAVDQADADDLEDEVRRLLFGSVPLADEGETEPGTRCPKCQGEEWHVCDAEGFEGYKVDRYEGLSEIWEAASLFEDHEADMVGACFQLYSDVAQVRELLENGVSCYASAEEYAQEDNDLGGHLSEDSHLYWHVDWEAVGEGLLTAQSHVYHANQLWIFYS